MGTRSSIFVKQTNKSGITKYTRFYKHWDGYPTGNLSLIHALCAIITKVKSVKSAMNLACTVDGSKAEYEGTKLSLNEIVSHNEHGDLEWTYLVDLDTKDVRVFESQNGTSDAVLNSKPTNPLEYVKCLIETARANEKYRIETSINSLKALGFKVNGY
jgi:hypothetical protein